MPEPSDLNPVEQLKTLMTELAKALVDETAAVQVEAFEDGDTTVLSLSVAPSDIGKLIGKQGRTARSLRTILGAASMKFHKRFSLDIVEVGDDGNDAPDDDNRGNR